MVALTLFARGWLLACEDTGCAGTVTGAGRHPVPPSGLAMLASFGLVGSRSCWGWCERAQPQQPIPSSQDAPDIGVPPHNITCARPSGSLWGWRVSRQRGVSQCGAPTATQIQSPFFQWPVQGTGGSGLSPMG